MDDKKNQLWADYQANLAQAQREAALARRQADEAAFLRQRQMNQALYGRGLANSGLQQLGTAQNQISMSQQLNEQAVQQAGVQAGLYQQYQQNLQGAEAQQQSLYTNIMNTALASGLTGTALTDYASKLASGYGTQLTADQLSAITETGTVANPEPFVMTGDMAATAEKWEPTVAPVNDKGVGYMVIEGETIKISSFDDAAEKYKNALKSRGIPMDDVTVIASRSLLSGDLNFKFNYKGNTYNKIVDVLKAMEAASTTTG